MFEKIKECLDAKRILILGFGKEGRSTLSFINDHIEPLSITVADKNPINDPLPDGVALKCGDDYMLGLDAYDVIIKSPGITFADQQQSVIAKTTSQTDLFLKEFRKQTIGITGTKGKSTTTTLIYHILKNSGLDAVLTGNIGIPPLDSARLMKADSVAVFEMSCHQLEFQRVSPRIAVLLNLFEDHLDHYGTREKYVEAKEHIFLHQQKDDCLVISADCIEQTEKAVSKVISVDKATVKEPPVDGISLVGNHNNYNIEVAKKVTELFDVSFEDFCSALKTYTPLPHRLEYVATKNGVEYYDDSISTVCQTTIQAVVSLKGVETVIVGGMDRGIDYTELADFFKENPLKNIILAYESGKRIAKMLEERKVSYIMADDLEEAVRLAAEHTSEGKRCVLSPAAASYGYFKNFEERGDVFKALVNKL